MLCAFPDKDGLYVRLGNGKVWAKFADGDEGGWVSSTKVDAHTIRFGGFTFDTTGKGALVDFGTRPRALRSRDHRIAETETRSPLGELASDR